MLIKRTPGATRVLGAPPNWNEAKHGICGTLPIRDWRAENGVNYMISTWEPTQDELALLQAGAPVLLWVVGVQHPPVSLTVGALAEPESEAAKTP